MAIRRDKGYWEIITTVAGRVEEKSKTFIAADPVKGVKSKKTTARKQALNDANSARRMARSIHANFSAGDYLFGADYSDDALAAIERRARKLQAADDGSGLIWEDYIRMAADHELENYLDRVRRRLTKDGIALKYIAVTSDMNGKTGELVRIHHHLIIPRECLYAFKEKWGRGRTVGRPIEDEPDHTRIAEYLCTQVRRVPDQKKYKSSRNLKKPKVSRRVAAGNAELRVPKGCELLYRGPFEPGWTSQYIRYYRPMRD